MAAFEHYVNAKWPLRVYAIEPVIAQQNVADASSRRMQTALDLVGSGPAGPLQGDRRRLTADRRAAEDETAVRLNPTMVGFGAGQSTFGWVFYPRLQTSGGRDGRLLTDIALLLNGRLPDPVGNDQSIEPGQRECTALIEMPNFIPKIEFVTVANWFRTSEVGDGQRSDLEKASVLGRKLVAAENALNRARHEGQVSTGRVPDRQAAAHAAPGHDAHPADDRAGPHRAPTTTIRGSSARWDCSSARRWSAGTAGRPNRAWSRPLFVEGRNFSVHDTHVVAGGQPAQSVLVSRHLLKVTIARDASPIPSTGGNPLLDINVATPNGVSNHLLIEMVPPDPQRKRDPAVVKAVQEKIEVKEVVLGKGEARPDRPKP